MLNLVSNKSVQDRLNEADILIKRKQYGDAPIDV